MFVSPPELPPLLPLLVVIGESLLPELPVSVIEPLLPSLLLLVPPLLLPSSSPSPRPTSISQPSPP